MISGANADLTKLSSSKKVWLEIISFFMPEYSSVLL